MNNSLFSRFAPVIRSLSVNELDGAPSLFEKLSLGRSDNLEVCYAPFEYINPEARVVLVGITPGKTQMLNALREARRQLELGASAQQALKAAKATGAFSGSMRPNLTGMLDAIGVHRWMGINSCTELFGSAANLVQTASVLRNPVFIDGGNYNGTPNMTRHPLLREQLINHFSKDMAEMRDAILIPLGDKVSEALHFLADRGFLDSHRILDGLPHPSGANAERIAYFLGKKAKHELSTKTNPNKLDESKKLLIQRVVALG